MILLFSESDIGFHTNINTECKIIPLSFVPTIKEKNNTYYPFVNLNNNAYLSEYIELYRSNPNITFLIGFDLDENGEFMAHALKNYLIKKDIAESDIIRTPLSEDGYLATNKFLDITNYVKFRKLQKEFLIYLKNKGIAKMGITDLLSLKYLDAKKGKFIELDSLEKKINYAGSSTITFVTNELLKEEN